MKGIKLISWLLPIALLGFTACGNVRELPTEKVITIYNSNLEKTNKMDMLDTLYVQVAGLKPNELHTVEALDPNNKIISKMIVMADENGVIPPSALWYDVGMRKDNKKPDIGGSLSVNAFYIHVTGPDTDYKEPVYIVYSTQNVGQQPKPIAFATYSSATGWGVENAFDETGTKNASGNPGKTKVYVEATKIPATIGSSAVSSVDVYVIPSKGAGNLWTDGETLTDKFTVRKLNVPVTDDGTGAKKLNPTLVWDLDSGPTLVNPTESNSAYDIVLDVNKNGTFDIGQDVNSDGKIDRYVDGIDGQGVVGFIVANTPANDFFVTLTDAAGNKVDTIPDSGAALYIKMENVPAGSAPVLQLYQHLTTTNAYSGATPTLTLSSANSTAGYYLPYVDTTKFIDTSNSSLTPTGISNASTVAYDLVVTGIGSTNYTKTIRVTHPPAQLITTSDSGGNTTATLFDETGTTGGNTQVYVKTTGLSLSGTATVYVVPTRSTAWTNGTLISNFVVSKKVDPISGNLLSTLLWDLNTSPTLINPTSVNNTYDVILDADNDGFYDTGEVVNSPGFSVRDTAANDTPNLLYANIASGGKFTHDSSWNYDYDYRDNFASNGMDTLQTYYVKYGIKAIWNPYIRWWGDATTSTTPSLYYGTYVDIYIVDANKAKGKLTKANLTLIKLGQGDFADVSGGKKTIPVQSSCYNGAGQQNIWLPKFKEGKYYVIVDVNANGNLDEGIDIIDAVNKDGKSIKDDSSIVGFTVN